MRQLLFVIAGILQKPHETNNGTYNRTGTIVFPWFRAVFRGVEIRSMYAVEFRHVAGFPSATRTIPRGN